MTRLFRRLATLAAAALLTLSLAAPALAQGESQLNTDSGPVHSHHRHHHRRHHHAHHSEITRQQDGANQ